MPRSKRAPRRASRRWRTGRNWRYVKELRSKKALATNCKGLLFLAGLSILQVRSGRLCGSLDVFLGSILEFRHALVGTEKVFLAGERALEFRVPFVNVPSANRISCHSPPHILRTFPPDFSSRPRDQQRGF